MKSIKLSIVALFIASASFAQVKDAKTDKVRVADAPIMAQTGPKQSAIKWDEEMHDFGDIEKGKPVTHEFSFVNNTKETILITNVRPACGCTAANYTKTPIKPGEKGMVAATFDAKSPAPFHKTVTITTKEGGVESVKGLSIKGKVIDTTAEQKASIK